MFAIKDTSNFNLDNYPYDCPIVICELNEEKIPIAQTYNVFSGIDSEGSVVKAINCNYLPEIESFGFNSYDYGYIVLDENNPQKFIINYGD